jgi:transcriptional regulator with XRE-family HTH domain
LHNARVPNHATRYKSFRLALKQARKASKLTQVQVAQRLNRPQSFVSKYEQGERRLDVIEFSEVAQALGVDPVAFLRNILK